MSRQTKAIQCSAVVRPLRGGAYRVLRNKSATHWVVCGDNCSVRMPKRDDISSDEDITRFALQHYTAAEWFK